MPETSDQPSADPFGGLHLQVLEASPNAIVAVDSRGVIAYANPQTEITFGYHPDEVRGRPIEHLMPSRVAPRHLGHRDRFLAQPIARPMGIGLDLAGRRSDGSEFPVEISLAKIGSGDDLLVFATVVDITARKEAETRLAESERRFRAVLEASPNAIVGVDGSGRITYANPRVAGTFGWEPNELIGQAIEVLMPSDVAERHVAKRDGFLARPVARPMGIGLDLAGRRRDGAAFPVEISLSPVDTAEGMVVFATIVDITARKSAEAQLLQARKMESIGRLAGGIAHDFNNVLFAIRGYSELVAEDLERAPEEPLDLPAVRQRIEAIADAADRAASLTAQLLSFSRRQVVSPRVIDPRAAIESVVPMIRSLIGEHIRLELTLDPATGPILIDPGQFDQILVNLAVNARDAMPTGGSIRIASNEVLFEAADVAHRPDMRPGPHVVLTVSDTGEGMDAETREHAFEPFFTTKEQGHGTGLGLATIYGIVRQGGGYVWLYSEPGLGSTFKLYFPRADGAVDAFADVGPAPAVAFARVLVVEDDDAVRDMTTQMLGRAGFRVVSVADGAAALDLLDRGDHPIDVMVSDVIMPGMSGVELSAAVHDRDPSIGVVLLSGYTREVLALEHERADGVAVLAKPVTSRQLLDAIRQVRRR